MMKSKIKVNIELQIVIKTKDIDEYHESLTNLLHRNSFIYGTGWYGGRFKLDLKEKEVFLDKEYFGELVSYEYREYI